MCNSNPNDTPTTLLETNLSNVALKPRFGFGGELNDVLETYFSQDVAAARLSKKFRMYYRLRPLIPVSVRQTLQRSRNKKLSVPENWYIHREFCYDFRKAVTRELKTNANRKLIHPWPEDYEFALVLTHDIETQQGVELVPRLAELEQEYGFRSVWNFVPFKYRIDSGLIKSLQMSGHEVGVHGYNHDGRLFTSRAIFKRRAVAINRSLTEFGATGFRAPMMHRNLEWLQDLEIEYDASCFDVDPYQAMKGGVGGMWPFIAGKFVELPYTLPQDHTLLVTLGHNSADIWRHKLKIIKRWAGMAMLISHPDYLNTEGRLDVYRQLLEHLQEQSGMWATLPSAVASWWTSRQESRIDERTSTIVGSCAQTGRINDLYQLFGEAIDDPFCDSG